MSVISSVQNESKASVILDYLRFFSALVVFWYHFGIQLPGYQAVMIFFVLSGYFISSTVLKSISRNKWSWGQYLLKRLTRLWVVLIPCLVLTFFWAKIQLGAFGESSLIFVNRNINDFLDFKTFLGNVFFLQGIEFETYGLNGPLWSLNYEFWYYVLFPCLLLMIYSNRTITKIIYFMIFLAISFFIGQRIMLYFLIWLLGAVIPLIKPLAIESKKSKILIFSFTIILAFTSLYLVYYLLGINNPTFQGTGKQFVADLSVGASFALLLFVVVSFFNNNDGSKNKISSLGKELAGFSYTLYLTHYPLVYFYSAWRTSIWSFEGIALTLIKPLIVIAILLYAWLIGSLTEKHTEKIRHNIFVLLKKRMPKNIKISN
ncbi:acyltransferase family protein [Peribacillus deserti]|uniref:acyltransferase family protein n=1 Tax=Peribacillus deserti TaxID=673318 RepID=UPI0015E099F9|nr:acyltransferase [Peribacillus deserti]